MRQLQIFDTSQNRSLRLDEEQHLRHIVKIATNEQGFNANWIVVANQGVVFRVLNKRLGRSQLNKLSLWLEWLGPGIIRVGCCGFFWPQTYSNSITLLRCECS